MPDEQAPDSPTDEPLRDRLARALGAHYEVRGLVGRGGFAEVYEVWDTQLERKLAIKVLRPDIAWTSGMLDRFRQEARAVAKLAHPHILPIHFVGEGEGLLYYAMPFVSGSSLGDLLRSGAMDLGRVVELIEPILDALQHAHTKGLIHRDIKPDNIMIDDATGRALLMDFGIAKQVDAGKGHTQTGFVVGTPHYMSPEQALGQGGLDNRSDLYAVGAMLYQMVTGAPPFDADTSQEVVAKHISEPAPTPSAVNARVPGELSDVIVRCLAKRPAERYQTAESLSKALRAAQGSAPGAASPEGGVPLTPQADWIGTDSTALLASAETEQAAPGSPPATARSGPRLHRALWVAAGIAVLALAAGGLLYATWPTLVVENHLTEPVRLSLTGHAERDIGAGDRLSLRVGRGGTLIGTWHLMRPVTPEGTPMGVEIRGTIFEDPPRGTMRYVARGRAEGRAFFAPLITNATDQPLEVTVNAGLQGAESCGCEVPPGATRMHVGYYELFRNSTVRVRDPTGRTATFVSLGPEVDPESGQVGLRFESRDLR